MSAGKVWIAAHHANTISPPPGKFKLNPSRTRKVKKEKKKMSWLKKKFAKWSREAWAQQDESYPVDSVSASREINASTSMRFTVYPASGGYVIEHYKNDRHREGDGPALTIVNNGESLGTAVEHILAIESLKA